MTMGKIQFKSGKTKTKVFEDSSETKKAVLPIAEKVDPWAEIQEKKPDKTENEKQQYKNAAEVYEYIYSKLTLKYNIDTISVYQLSDKKSTDGRLHYHKVYGTDISPYEIEKFFGYDSPFIRTNAAGFTDNRMHRARLIERFGNRLIVVSSSAYEVFRSEYDLQMIRIEMRSAFKEVDRF